MSHLLGDYHRGTQPGGDIGEGGSMCQVMVEINRCQAAGGKFQHSIIMLQIYSVSCQQERTLSFEVFSLLK